MCSARSRSSSDTRAPTILLQSPASGTVVAENFAVAGRVLDNLSGVMRLNVQLDDGAFAELPFDAAGNFTLTTTLPLDGSADAAHVLRFRGTDAAGNVSPLKAFFFTLDTRAPALSIDTPVNAGSVDAATLLSGLADGTGSPITRLTYQLDAGAVIPVTFDPATGRFDQSLDLSRLAAGSHTLSVTAGDAAGHETTVSRSVNLPTAIPFGIRSFTPAMGLRTWAQPSGRRCSSRTGRSHFAHGKQLLRHRPERHEVAGQHRPGPRRLVCLAVSSPTHCQVDPISRSTWTARRFAPRPTERCSMPTADGQAGGG